MRLSAIDPSTTAGKTRELFDMVEQRVGKVSNMLRLMAHSPLMLEAYLKFNQSLKDTRVTGKLRGLITAAIAEISGCDYMLSLAYVYARPEGITQEELQAARRMESADPKIAAALQFSAQVVRNSGHVAGIEVKKLQDAGYSEEEVVEIIVLICLNIFRNYFNLLADTEIDLPLVKTRQDRREAIAS